MKTYDALPITIDREPVLRYLGYQPGKQELSAAILELVDGEIAGSAAIQQPRAVYTTWEVEAVTDRQVSLKGTPLALVGADIARHLARAEWVTVMAATVGPRVEPAVAEMFAGGEYSRAVVVDAVASEGAEQTAEAVNQIIAGEAKAAGYQTTSRYSPGYGDWDVRIQADLLLAAGAEAIGISASDSSMLIPRKSVTAVIGWVRGDGPAASTGCFSCNMVNCPYRGKHGEGNQ